MDMDGELSQFPPLPPHISLLLRLLTMFVWMDSGIGSLLAFAVAISSDYNEENKL